MGMDMNMNGYEIRVFDSMTATKIGMTPEKVLELVNQFNTRKIEDRNNQPTMRDWFDMIGVDYKKYEPNWLLDSTPSYIGFLISIEHFTNTINYKIVYRFEEIDVIDEEVLL